MRCYANRIDLGVAIATQFEEMTTMPAGFWPVIVIIVLVIVWVLAKVLFYARKSEEQWKEADKSKIKDWDDDEW